MKLDKTGFKLLERKRRFKAQTIEIAKRRILDQAPAVDLAKEYSVNVQRVYMIQDQVETAWSELSLPPGWAEVTIAAPKILIEEFQERCKEARIALLREIEQVIKTKAKPKKR